MLQAILSNQGAVKIHQPFWMKLSVQKKFISNNI